MRDSQVYYTFSQKLYFENFEIFKKFEILKKKWKFKKIWFEKAHLPTKFGEGMLWIKCVCSFFKCSKINS